MMVAPKFTELLDHRPDDLALTLDDVQGCQRSFDESHWTSPSSSAEKRRHILFHLAILVGKLARIEERADHAEDSTTQFNEAVSDLVVFAAQLADVGGARLQDLYVNRLVELHASESVARTE